MNEPEELNWHTMHDKELEHRLRAALDHEADRMVPLKSSNAVDIAGLNALRARVAAEAASSPPSVASLSAHRRRTRWVIPVAAAAAVLALVVVTPNLLRHDDSPVREVAPAASAHKGVAPLPVYFIATGPAGQTRIVREYVATSVTKPERVQAAVRLAVAGTGPDADYTSAWRRHAEPSDTGGTATSISADSRASMVNVTTNAGQIVITLDPQLTHPAGQTPTADARATAELAVQQLVWTATAAAGRDLPVVIKSTGPVETSLLPLGTALRRSQLTPDLRAPVWINSIIEGQAVSRGQVRITGDGSAKLTTPPEWVLEHMPGGTPAAAGTAQNSSTVADSRREWNATFTVSEPGTYRLSVTSADWTDTRTLVVR